MNRKKISLLRNVIIIFAVIIVAAIIVIAVGKSKIDEYKANVDELLYEIESNRQIVYVVKDGMQIKKGEILIAEGEEANVMKQEIYSGLESDYYITDEDIGSIAIVDMESQTPIMKNMIMTMLITHDTREFEINVVDLMLDQKVNDYIDVRIMFPNGEDYTVLSKKQIKNLVLDSSVFYTYLNEEEILRLSCATVDAYTMTGTKIYATRYVEGNIQNTSKPDYLVSAQTIDRMASDPNIVTIATETMNLSARMSMEQRMSGLSEEQLQAVAEGHGIVDTAKNSILVTGATFAIDENINESESSEETEEGLIHETLPGEPLAGETEQKTTETVTNGLNTLSETSTQP